MNQLAEAPAVTGSGRPPQIQSDEKTRRAPLKIASVSKVKGAVTSKTYVSISVDQDGHIDFESEIEPHYADRMTDVLLLVLVKAREARAKN